MKLLKNLDSSCVLEESSETQPQKAFKRTAEESLWTASEKLMKSKITEILDNLSDGKWHALDEIQRKTSIEASQLGSIIDFLAEYNFIIFERKANKAKLEEKAQRFLTQTAT